MFLNFWIKKGNLTRAVDWFALRRSWDVYYKRMSVIKSTAWETENEWRLMWHNDTGGLSVYKCPISRMRHQYFYRVAVLCYVAAFVEELKRAFPNAGISGNETSWGFGLRLRSIMNVLELPAVSRNCDGKR